MINKVSKIRTRYIAPLQHQPFQKTMYPNLQSSSILQESSLIISNIEERYSLKYGMDFKGFLDARDQVMQHQFDFRFDLDQSQLLKEGKDIIESQLYKRIKNKIKHFLAESIGNIVSAGFKFLCKSDLEEGQAKEMASKNTMLNIISVYRHTIKAIFDKKLLI